VQKQYGSTGLGAYPTISGTVANLKAQNAMQTYFLNNSRLGIPVTFHAETLHSAGAQSTIFPMPVTQVCTALVASS
jgi:hypothetical protein